MLQVRKIIKAKKETIKVLRQNPLSDLKLIERFAKCLKDPNPLSTMMRLTNTKYPLTVDTQKAEAFKIPEELMAPKKIRDDLHYHGRSLCKKELIID